MIIYPVYVNVGANKVLWVILSNEVQVLDLHLELIGHLKHHMSAVDILGGLSAAEKLLACGGHDSSLHPRVMVEFLLICLSVRTMDTFYSGTTPTEPCRESLWLLVLSCLPQTLGKLLVSLLTLLIKKGCDGAPRAVVAIFRLLTYQHR